MSESFQPARLITVADLFGGRLEKHGVRGRIVEEQDAREWAAKMGLKPHASAEATTTERSRCLTDGENCMWVEISERGIVASITRYGMNEAHTILHAIAQEFNTDMISENDPEFWEEYEGEVVAIDMSGAQVIKRGSDA